MRDVVLAICLAFIPVFAAANPVAEQLPDAKIRGKATLKILGMSLYSARLFTVDGGPLNWSEDFALELTYQRSFSQRNLVDATLREMERIGAVPPSAQALATCFQAVKPGDQYTAISNGDDRLVFWRNGKVTCDLGHPGIKLGFMGIFLGDDTRSRRFTMTLLGQ